MIKAQELMRGHSKHRWSQNAKIKFTFTITVSNNPHGGINSLSYELNNVLEKTGKKHVFDILSVRKSDNSICAAFMLKVKISLILNHSSRFFFPPQNFKETHHITNSDFHLLWRNTLNLTVCILFNCFLYPNILGNLGATLFSDFNNSSMFT